MRIAKEPFGVWCDRQGKRGMARPAFWFGDEDEGNDPTRSTEEVEPEDQESRREKKNRETKRKHQHWFNVALEIKAEGKFTHPGDIASEVAKREHARMKKKGTKEKGVNGPNIHRRLNDLYSGWAE